jgi:hypothetical protein
MKMFTQTESASVHGVSSDASARVRRAGQISEAFTFLEAVFYAPDCFGDCSLGDAAESLASEFRFNDEWHDEPIIHRLDKFVAAAEAGRLKQAGQHLNAVRTRLAERWGLTDSSISTLKSEEKVLVTV